MTLSFLCNRDRTTVFEQFDKLL